MLCVYLNVSLKYFHIFLSIKVSVFVIVQDFTQTSKTSSSHLALRNALLKCYLSWALYTIYWSVLKLKSKCIPWCTVSQVSILIYQSWLGWLQILHDWSSSFSSLQIQNSRTAALISGWILSGMERIILPTSITKSWTASWRFTSECAAYHNHYYNIIGNGVGLLLNSELSVIIARQFLKMLILVKVESKQLQSYDFWKISNQILKASIYHKWLWIYLMLVR